MRILNPSARDDVARGRSIRLNVGCGVRPMAGYYGVDHLELPGVDIVADLNRPLNQLPDNSVEAIYTRHTLEHVRELLPLMAEFHRVCRHDAKLEVIVPHFSNPFGYSDPTHVRFFGLYSFFYFSDESDQPRRKVPSFYIPERFVVDSVHVSLIKGGLLGRITVPLVKRLVNRGIGTLDWYERGLCRRFPAESIHFQLRVKKPTRAATAIAA